MMSTMWVKAVAGTGFSRGSICIPRCRLRLRAGSFPAAEPRAESGDHHPTPARNDFVEVSGSG